MNDPNVEAFLKAKHPWMAFFSMLVKRVPPAVAIVALALNPNVPVDIASKAVAKAVELSSR